MHRFFAPRIGQNYHAASVGIEKSDPRHLLNNIPTIDAPRTSADGAGEMGQRPVLAIPCDPLGFRIQRNQPGAGKRPNVRFPVLIQHQIPGDNAARPVVQNVCEAHAPECPVGLQMRVFEPPVAVGDVDLDWPGRAPLLVDPERESAETIDCFIEQRRVMAEED